MDAKKIAEALQDAEIAVLKALSKRPLELEELAKTTLLNKDLISRACLWLQNKALVVVKETPQSFAALDRLGEKYASQGLPEKRFLKVIKDAPLYTDQIAERAGLDKQEVQHSLGHLKKHNFISLEDGKVKLLDKKYVERKTHEELLLEHLSKEKEVEVNLLPKEEHLAFDELRPRGIVKKIDRTVREYSITDLGKKTVTSVTAEKRIGLLTPGIITSGDWKNSSFRRYDVEAAVPKFYPGKKQAYRAFLDEVREELVSLGFEEITGPLVETSFWNNDALFMPQDHPARGIHDIYYVRDPKYGDLKKYEKFVKAVKTTHENGGKSGGTGWGYEFDEKETARLILRSHDTGLAARAMLSPGFKIPGAYFYIPRVFRPEKLDQSHLFEFNQTAGFVVDEKINFRHLLGLLKQFATKFAGTDKIVFRPGYFPFTEPSVEMFVWSKDFNKWLELGGAGIFRPELGAPLGVKAPMIAWGIGVERLFMMREKISDIRQLFSQDIQWLREAKL